MKNNLFFTARFFSFLVIIVFSSSYVTATNPEEIEKSVQSIQYVLENHKADGKNNSKNIGVRSITTPRKTDKRNKSKYNVIVSTGQFDNSGRKLVEIDSRPSINDYGCVTFMGKITGQNGRVQNIYFVDPDTGIVRPLMHSVFEYPEEGDTPRQIFSPPQINNDNVVLARRWLTAYVQIGFPFGRMMDMPLSYLEKWDSSLTYKPVYQVASGDAGLGSAWSLLFFLRPVTGMVYPSSFVPLSPWDAILEHYSINNKGGTVFLGLESDKCYYAIPQESPYKYSADVVSNRPYVWIADNDEIFISSQLGNIVGQGIFSVLGGNPAINNDATSLAFYGDITNQTGNIPGPGIFVFDKIHSLSYRVCGLSGNGQLDPGETYTDVNSNGIFDPGVDKDEGIIHGFYTDDRVCVNNNGFVIYFATNRDGNKAIFQSRINISGAVADIEEPIEVVAVGDAIAELSGLIQNLDLYDSLNDRGKSGEIVFWADTGYTQSLVIAGGRHNMVKLLDPLDYEQQPKLLDGDRITLDTDKIATADNLLKRNGVVADGVSKLILCIDADKEGDEFYVDIIDNDSNSELNGILMSLDGQKQSATTITTSAVNTVEGPRAFAIYQAPEIFAYPVSEERSREIYIVVTNRSTNVSIFKNVQIHRPQVLLVHGLWSNSDTWDTAVWNNSSKFSFKNIDYKETNAEAFYSNGFWLDTILRSIIKEYKIKHNVAGVKCDIVGHSMGGMISRWYMSENLNFTFFKYLKDRNYNSGSIRKLITIGTPHSGSPWGNILFENKDMEICAYTSVLVKVCFTLGELLNKIGKPIDRGAIFDLAIPEGIFLNNGTSKVNSQLEVPCNNHAIYTNVNGPNPQDIFQDGDIDIGTAINIMLFLSDFTYDTIFEGDGNDMIVSVTSQRGGLSSTQSTTVNKNVAHIPFPLETIPGQTGDADINKIVEDLLEKPLDDPAFADNFNPVKLRMSDMARRLMKKQKITEPSVFVEIVSPEDGIQVAPGETVTVTAQGNDGHLSKVLFVTSDTTHLDEEPPFEFSLQIPDEVLGSYLIGALGKDTDNGNSYAEIHVDVKTDASLVLIDVQPETVFLEMLNLDFPISVKGDYSDGIQRDISDPDRGTTYSSENPSVVTVSDSGVLKAVANGSAHITVQNGELSKTINAIVQADSNTVIYELDSAIFALKILAGINESGVYSVEDINGDKKVGLEEVIYILQYLSDMREKIIR